MKQYKIGFKLDWLEMIFVFGTIFFAGIMISSTVKDKCIYSGLILVSAGILVVRKKIKIPLKK